jgi:drug/metabolite transporter (DMT)-like permease
VRFFASALILAFFCWRTLIRTTRSELFQGIGLGFFGGMGIILQMIGLSFTSASVSAFLTQTFCIYIPIFVAIRDRKAPPTRVIISTVLMIFGVAVLNTLDFRSIHLGLGEWLTILAAIFFSGQILWLEKPAFQKNNVMNASIIMFLVIAAMSFPLIVVKMHNFGQILAAYRTPGVLILTAVLIFFCTICAFVLMNKWQPFVPATEAAMIYGFEPVWASLFALFLPGLMSAAFFIGYPNETLTWNLIIGGSLILASNLVLQLRWKTAPKFHARVSL